MIVRALILLSVGGLLAACDKLPNPMSQQQPPPASSSSAAVAVLDLGAVAKALGRDEVFKEQVEAAGKELQQQLTQFSSGLQDKLREEQAKLGDAPSEAERQQLQNLVADAQRQVQQSQLLARQKAAEFQNQLATRFRAEVQPIAAEIARDKGASSVLLSNSVMWFEPAVDITGAVIDAMRAQGAAAGAPARPEQSAPQ